MITNISIVSVFVKDVDEAHRFYTEILGFQPKNDITLGDGFRWCTVVHPDQPELQVHLTVPGPPLSPELTSAIQRAQAEGGMTGLGLNVDDCRKTYDTLLGKGVEFTEEPTERPYGIDCGLRDPFGNQIRILQPKGWPS